jgi:signal transduction histidine kinase
VSESFTTLLSLVSALADPKGRTDAAQRLARQVGATSLRIFVLDADLGILVAAQGLRSTLPAGPGWDAFLTACRRPGTHHGEVADFEGDRLVPATGYVGENGSTLAFAGASLALDPEQLALPLLDGLFRAEQRAWAAGGQFEAASEAARHANALTTALDRSRNELERAIQTKEQLVKDRELLLGIVGHDLRNPLNTVVMGTSMLIERGDLPAGHVKKLLRIKAASLRMTRMIADLLDFERSREGTIAISRSTLRLRDVITQVLEEIEVSHPTRTLQLVADSDGLGAWDADRFAQVISNLIGNALQHSPSHTPVTVALEESLEEVILEVSNVQRQAIRAADLSDVFEPFRRGKDSTGLGLGLYIVQQVAKAHGGSVEAKTHLDRTTFTVRLPRAHQSIAAPPGDA